MYKWVSGYNTNATQNNIMTKIRPTKILFIKLGEGGKYEKDCIENDQNLRLGYRAVDHQSASIRTGRLFTNILRQKRTQRLLLRQVIQIKSNSFTRKAKTLFG